MGPAARPAPAPAPVRGASLAAAAAGIAVAALAPASAGAVTERTSFQMVQLTPSRVYAQTSFLPFALPDPPDRVYRYRLGSRVFVGPWFPASVGGQTTTELLDRVHRAAHDPDRGHRDGGRHRRPSPDGPRAQPLPHLADLYRDADVLVVAAGHPACAGLTVAQARAIARGSVTRWSQVVAGAPADAIRVRHPVDASGEGVPHLGTRWVGRLNRWRVNYAPGAVGARDGGVAAAAADPSIAAITTWSRLRQGPAGVCAVPLNGVAPSDAAVAGLAYPEAFPVAYVVTRRVVGGGQTVVMRRAMAAHLNSAKVKAMLRGQGLLVVGDPLPAPPAAS